MGIVRQMIQQDSPPPAVAAALDGLDEAIRGSIPPIWIEPMKSGGYCEWDGGTEGEIKLSDTLCGLRFNPDSASRPHNIRNTILHEFAHRLVGPCGTSTGHNGAFLAMHLTLSFRANNLDRDDDWPDWHSITLYDTHDHFDDPHITMPQALSWAWSTAQELSKTSSTAEECATLIKERWAKYVDAQARRAERMEQRKIQQKQAERDAEQERRTHRLDKIYLFGFGLIGYAGLILVAAHH
jgi:hypothetical protein